MASVCRLVKKIWKNARKLERQKLATKKQQVHLLKRANAGECCAKAGERTTQKESPYEENQEKQTSSKHSQWTVNDWNWWGW